MIKKHNNSLITGRSASRRIFIEYIFSQLFGEEDMETVVNCLKVDEPKLEYNEKYLIKLIDTFHKNKENSENLITEFIIKELDNMKYVIIMAGISEFHLNDPALVISEYLKISDFFELQSPFIHGILDNIAKKAYPKISEEPTNSDIKHLS